MASPEALSESRKQLIKKPPKRIFHPIIAMRGMFQVDIAFMQYEQSKRYIEANHGMRCMLVAIEIATRYGYAVPMPDKSSESVVEAFKTIYHQAEAQQIESESVISPIQTVTTDDGSEFTNQAWKDLMQSLGIMHYIKEPDDRFSLGVIDRFIRTLKTWIEDWQIEHDSLEWVTALPEVLHKYNNHYIRKFNATPQQLRDMPERSQEVYNEGKRDGKRAIDRFNQFNVGDMVRIRLEPQERTKVHKGLAKGVQRWSNAVYKITKVDGLSFELQDSLGRPALRTYRQHELMKVPPTSVDVPDIFAGVARESRRARRMQREGLM